MFYIQSKMKRLPRASCSVCGFIILLFALDGRAGATQICYNWLATSNQTYYGTAPQQVADEALAPYFTQPNVFLAPSNCSITGNPSLGTASAVCNAVWSCSPTACTVPQSSTTTIGARQLSATCTSPLYFVSAFRALHTQTGVVCGLGDPINPATGNVFRCEDDFGAPSGETSIRFSRYYNSDTGTSGDLGTGGWTHSYSRHIQSIFDWAKYSPSAYVAGGANSSTYSDLNSACVSGFQQIRSQVAAWQTATATYVNGICVLSNGAGAIGTLPILIASGFASPPSTTALEFDVTRDDGQVVRFTVQGGAITAPPGIALRLQQTGSGFLLTDERDNVETYDVNGRLLSIQSRTGVFTTLSFDSSQRMNGVSDSFGHSLTIAYDTKSRLSTVTDQAAHVYTYGYDSVSRFASITNADTTTRSYVYTSSGPFDLTGVIDESNTRYSTWAYDSSQRGASAQEAGGADLVNLVFNADGSMTSTDALGAIRTFTFSRVGDRNLTTGISGSQCPTCQESAVTTYDIAGWVASRTDYNGNLTCYANDPARGLELVRIEGFAPGSTCPSGLATYTPASGTQQRMITTQWSASFRLPAMITEANRTTSFSYDGSGNLLSKTITDTTVTPNVARTWGYTYDSYGRMLTADGPRTDVADTTTYANYTCTTGFQCGQLQTITDALGHITTFNTYNAAGQPLTITDPNGVVTTLAYDARRRLTSSQVGTETTGYSYWPIGLLETVTLPDSSTITYTYDSAHRLTKITDSLGNHINYTLDALGNRTADNTYDANSTLRRTHTRVFTALSQLYKDINAAGTAAVTTTLTYDAQGNQTNIKAPMSRNTINAFDALNRAGQITDPNSGITQLSYDANDNLASVIDPRILTTSYAHNGFGDVTQLISPDTGTSSSTYDSGGNLKSTTDARGAMATYSYDALNRVTEVAYTDQTLNFTYDAGTNGVGRLTGASDANHSLSWAYDSRGRVTGKGQTIGTVTQSVGYAYTNGDLVSVMTPSGQTVTYGYSNHRITSVSVNGTAILSAATYDPFGPAKAWTWGNATTVSRTFDQDGNPTQIVTAGITNGYSIDNASRITGISDSGLTSNSWTFGYDLLDRVNAGTSTATTRGYTYDANSNRLTTTGAAPSTETIATASNQLNSTTGSIARTYSYDAAGNTLGYGSNSYTFNQRGRMSQATVSGSYTNYLYNALGQLIHKSAAGGTTILMYDENGHILGEYTGTGALIQETIWMGDTPVATLQPNGSSISIYYVHTDHLGTPRKITRPSDNGLIWRWDPDTFGSLPPNANPAGLGTFTYNLRFPGMYALAESGLFYNGDRTYDPQTGRYLESDAIGLYGGNFSTYSYAQSNPISLSDPTGDQAVLAAPIVGGLLVVGCAITPSCAKAVSDALSNALNSTNNVTPLPGVAPAKDAAAGSGSDHCPPECTRSAASLELNKKAALLALELKSIPRVRAIAQYNSAATSINKSIAAHNARCPNKVEHLPIEPLLRVVK